jgi:hypothetical protein
MRDSSFFFQAKRSTLTKDANASIAITAAQRLAMTTCFRISWRPSNADTTTSKQSVAARTDVRKREVRRSWALPPNGAINSQNAPRTAAYEQMIRKCSEGLVGSHDVRIQIGLYGKKQGPDPACVDVGRFLEYSHLPRVFFSAPK